MATDGTGTAAVTTTDGSLRRRQVVVAGGVLALAAAFGLDASEVDARNKRRKRKKRRKHGKGGDNGRGGGRQVCSNGCTRSVCGQTPAGCPILPINNIWNRRVDDQPVDARSDAYVASIGVAAGLHPDFGSGLYEGKPFGIPLVRVSVGQPGVRVSFTGAADESDPGPYPIPADAPVENGPCSTGDRHVITVDASTCKLYEVFDAHRGATPTAPWSAGSGAVFDLRSNALRPETHTSADAAGLPMLPGLVRFDEVAAGHIDHAIRFTANRTQKAYVWPARHYASDVTDPNVPPMGAWFRLRADYPTDGLTQQAKVIVEAMKVHGIILADNGSSWFMSGTPDERWDNQALSQVWNITGNDMEAIDQSSLMVDPNSGQIRK